MGKFDYTIWTDGGCAKNPNGKGGYGIVIQDNASCQMKTIFEGFKSSTNNRMEVRAILRALEEVPKGSTVEIFSDSKYAIMCFTGAWQRKKNLDLWAIADTIMNGLSVEFKWVKGHADNDNNNLCDTMATKAMEQDDSKLLDDVGFIPVPSKSKKKRKAPAVSSVDTFTGTAVEPMLPDAYVGLDVFQRISAVNMSDNPSADDFRRLGFPSDFWSFQPFSALRFYFGECIVSYLSSYFDKEADICAALQWHGRGLSIENAVRKTLVDNIP